MKITVERTVNEKNELVFTITCREPHNVPFTDDERGLLKALDTCKGAVEELLIPEHKLRIKTVSHLHDIKEKLFSTLLSSLQFAIRNHLNPKMEPMRQEIYNWIYDCQEGDLKRWMQEFDPQRTKFYFDNDRTIESDEEECDIDLS